MTWDQQEADAVKGLLKKDYANRTYVAHLEQALAKYARHLDTCHTKMHGDTCTCGLRRALEKP